jgi:hypothetical protein
MEKGSLSDRSGLYSFIRPDGETLFDFQLAAVSHCVGRLAQGEAAVLGLDTGLGKTFTVRAVLDAMKARALVIVPGGLVRQVAQSLRRMPWEKSDNLVVLIAETGKQLGGERPPHDVLVVNRALGGASRDREQYDVVVVDEAHQRPSVRTVCRGYGRQRDTPVLFLTACPGEAPDLADWFRPYGSRRSAAHSKAFAESCFVIEKTPRVLETLGAARPRMVLLPGETPDLATYGTEVLHGLNYTGSIGPISRARAVLHVADTFPMVAAAAARMVRYEAVEALSIDPPVTFPRGDFVRRCKDLCDAHNVPWPGPPPVLVSEEGTAADERLRCRCCGLNDAECSALYTAHCRAAPTVLPPWAEEANHAKGFTSALVRFPNKSCIDDALRQHPVPPSVLVFVLTTDKSASYRSTLIKKFSSHDGQKAKLGILARAIRMGTAPQALLRVGALGMGRLLLTQVEQCLARPRLLLADSTVDVGFDLHRHINGVYMSNLVRTPAELRQITGRVSRIAVDRGDQGTIDVLTRTLPGTLDDLFARHLAAADGPVDDSCAPLLGTASRVRQLLSADPEALQLFEKLWSRAGSAVR